MQPLDVSTQPLQWVVPHIVRIYTKCSGMNGQFLGVMIYTGSGRHDMRTKPCQDASTPQLVSTQPAPRGIATDGRQHTTLAVGRPTTNAHLYQLLQHAYRGSGRHDTSTCTKPCQDASTPQPVSTQPAPSGDAS